MGEAFIVRRGGPFCPQNILNARFGDPESGGSSMTYISNEKTGVVKEFSLNENVFSLTGFDPAKKAYCLLRFVGSGGSTFEVSNPLSELTETEEQFLCVASGEPLTYVSPNFPYVSATIEVTINDAGTASVVFRYKSLDDLEHGRWFSTHPRGIVCLFQEA